MNITCKHCGGEIAKRNPTGTCDHLHWPDNLTDTAKLANGLKHVEMVSVTWIKEDVSAAEMIDFLAGSRRS